MNEKRHDAARTRGGAGRGTRSKLSPARIVAFDVCRTVRERDAYAQDIISSRVDEKGLSSEDRAFATRLVRGVVSSSGTLDELIDRALRDPSDVQADVRDALRIAVYEIIFLDKSPHAAVDQGVELVRRVASRAAGLGNVVLRKIVAMKPAFPFGDPSCDVEAFARLHAFPLWLAKRLIADLGPDAAGDFMRASNEPAPLFLAVNAIRASDDEVYAALSQTAAQVVPVTLDGVRVPGCYRVVESRVLQDSRVKHLFDQGKVLVSDAASQMVAACVLPARKPAAMLEIGAGRGTKTILLQSGATRAYGSQMELTALDNHAFKIDLLRNRATEYGVHLAGACTGDATDMGEVFSEREFDAVFIDAPCSGLGTLRRHPEIRWRLTASRIDEVAELGLSMLRSSAERVAPGGEMTYATCTVTHTENNGVAKRFLESAQGSRFKLVPIAGRSCFSTRLTVGSSDAHFAVRFMRVR